MKKASDTAELLHALGYLYAHHGQTQRGLVLLLIAARIAPSDTGVLRTLAYALMEDGYGQRALAVIDRLAGLERLDSGGRLDAERKSSPMLQLLRSRALWVSGDKIEARRCFREYVENREQPEAVEARGQP
jgi:type III secretion protein Y